jgi:hypothetical protein
MVQHIIKTPVIISKSPNPQIPKSDFSVKEKRQSVKLTGAERGQNVSYILYEARWTFHSSTLHFFPAKDE